MHRKNLGLGSKHPGTKTCSATEMVCHLQSHLWDKGLDPQMFRGPSNVDIPGAGVVPTKHLQTQQDVLRIGSHRQAFAQWNQPVNE